MEINGIDVSEQLITSEDGELLWNVPDHFEGRFIVPSTVTCIDGSAFMGCKEITEVILHDNVKFIEAYAFSSCEKLKSIIIPNSVSRIGMNAFENCLSLTDIEIPNSVKEIGSYAFSGCKSLKCVYIPYSVEKIEEGAFDCPAYIDVKNETYCDIEGVVYTKDRKEIILYPRYIKDQYFEVPSSITSIYSTVFYKCDFLETIYFPEGFKSLGEFTIFGCNKLKRIFLPSTFSRITAHSIDKCDALEEIHIKVEDPYSIYYSDLEAYENKTTPTLYINKNVIIYVPIGSGYAYRNHPIWKKFNDIRIER